MLKRSILLSVVFFCSNSVLAGEGVIIRTAAVKQVASFTGSTLYTLKPGANVSISQRSGGWQKVEFNQQGSQSKTKGWVRTYQVRENSKGKKQAIVQSDGEQGAIVSGFSYLSNKVSGLFGSREVTPEERSNVVATIGIRGLNETDLKEAKANPEELKKLDQFTSNKEKSAAFAKQVKLVSHKIEMLEEPK